MYLTHRKRIRDSITFISKTALLSAFPCSYRELCSVSLEDPGQVQLLDLPLQTGGQTGVHGRTPREHNVLVKLCPGVYIGSLDGVKEQLRHSCPLDVDEVRLEEDFWCLKALPTELHNPTIGKL